MKERQEPRLTENDIFPEPNLWSLYSVFWNKTCIDLNLALTTSASRKCTPCCVCTTLHPVKLCLHYGHSAAPNRSTYLWHVTSRTSALHSVKGFHRSECDRSVFSSMFNVSNIDKVRTRTVFRLPECYLYRSSLRRFSCWRSRRIDLSFEPKRLPWM